MFYFIKIMTEIDFNWVFKSAYMCVGAFIIIWPAIRLSQYYIEQKNDTTYRNRFIKEGMPYLKYLFFIVLKFVVPASLFFGAGLAVYLVPIHKHWLSNYVLVFILIFPSMIYGCKRALTNILKQCNEDVIKRQELANKIRDLKINKSLDNEEEV